MFLVGLCEGIIIGSLVLVVGAVVGSEVKVLLGGLEGFALGASE